MLKYNIFDIRIYCVILYKIHTVCIISIIPLGINAILSVDDMDITENSATLICKLPCFSSNLQCVLSNFTLNSMDVNVTNSMRTGDITGSLMTYIQLSYSNYNCHWSK